MLELEIVQTKDGKLYKLDKEVFKSQSKFYYSFVEDQNQQILHLFTIDSSAFDYIFEFLQLHKQSQSRQLLPLKPGLSLNAIMEEADSQLIDRIFKLKQQQVKEIIDASFYLKMDDLQRRLTAGLVCSLNKQETKKLAEKSKESNLIDEEQISQEISKKITMILFKKQEMIKQEQTQ